MGTAVIILPFGLAQSQSWKFGTREMERRAGKKDPHGEIPSLERPERDTLSSLPLPAYLLLSCNSDRHFFSFLLPFLIFELHLARRSDTGFSDGGWGLGEGTFGIPGWGGREGWAQEGFFS